MFVGQNIPQGRTAKERARIIANRVAKFRKLVDKNPKARQSVQRATLIARQVAIQMELETNKQFKRAIADFLLNPDK
jgi:hypothetical protein